MRDPRSRGIETLEDFQRKYSQAGLLTRYARGRLAYFSKRQILTAVGAFLLVIFEGWQVGLAAAFVALAGELVDCWYLKRVLVRIEAGDPVARLYRWSAVTAGLQALTISGCVMMAWLGTHTHAGMLFPTGFLTGAAVNAGLVLPYHRVAGILRLAIYAGCAVTMIATELNHFSHLEEGVILNGAGAVMLAYMVLSFLQHVNRDFSRQRDNTEALIRQSEVLESTNVELRKREREAYELALVARNANDSVVLFDNQGCIFWVNDAFTAITGYTQDDAIGRTPGDLLNGPETDAETVEQIAQSVRQGRPFRGEIQNVTKDGRSIWIETNLVPVLDEHGRTDMTVAIERDITDAKEQARQLDAAMAAAKEGARAKAEFLATMSHEIRTPMNGIIGMADLLAETDLDGDAQLYAETIRNSGQALLTIINDVLDLSKLDAQKMSLSPEDFSLRDCLSDVVALLQPKAEEKGLTLGVEWLSAVPPKVHGDDGRIRQVLMNLVGNAVKFTETGGVTVTADVDTKSDLYIVTVDVQDTGIGIAKSNLEVIFEPFSQAEASTTRRFGGTGLGLAISKLLVEAMGGKISVTSVEGKGTRFRFTLVLQKAQSDPAANALAMDQIATSELAGLKVLVAEDHAVNRLLIEKYLNRTPVELIFATDGQEAVARTLSERPDIVFMDMAMPVLNGLEATQQIRMTADVQPVIYALTANAFASDRSACLEAGMDGFLTKPVSRATLISCLHRHRRMAAE